MLKRAFLCIILCYFTNACQLKKVENDINKKIANFQKKSSENDDSTYTYLNLSKHLIKKGNVKDSLKVENNYLLGHYFKSKGKIDSAAIYFHRVTDFINDSIKNNREINYFYYSWYTYLIQDKYGDCFSIIDKLKSKLRTENQDNLPLVYYMYENTYKANQNYKKALEINKLQINALKKLKDAEKDIRGALIIQAQYKYKNGDIKESYQILDSLISIENKLKSETKYNLYNEIGIHRYYEKKYDKALKSYLKGLENLHEMKDGDYKNNELSGTYVNISDAYLKLNNIKKSSAYLDSATTINLSKIRGDNQRNILKQQFEFASLTNKDFSKVYNYLDSIYSYQENKYTNKYTKELVALKKSITNEKIILAEKKDLEIKNLKRLFFLSTLLVLIIVISILLYKQRKHRFEKHSIQMQQRLLRSQMNPHFTFNTLYAIQNEIQDNPDKATNYLLKFSRLLRLILENSTQNFVLLGEEIEALKKYIQLQKFRFPNKFEFEMNLLNVEEDDLIFIPPMLIQPMIENSIEHGFSRINYTGKIKLTLELENDFLKCIIEDNGIGFNIKNKSTKTTTSTFLINKYLRNSTKKGIEIINKSDNKNKQSGVIVKLSIPYKLTEND